MLDRLICAMGFEPAVVSGRPCDSPGWPLSTNPSVSLPYVHSSSAGGGRVRAVGLDIHRGFCDVAIHEGGQTRSAGRSRQRRSRWNCLRRVSRRRCAGGWRARPAWSRRAPGRARPAWSRPHQVEERGSCRVHPPADRAARAHALFPDSAGIRHAESPENLACLHAAPALVGDLAAAVGPEPVRSPPTANIGVKCKLSREAAASVRGGHAHALFVQCESFASDERRARIRGDASEEGASPAPPTIESTPGDPGNRAHRRRRTPPTPLRARQQVRRDAPSGAPGRYLRPIVAASRTCSAERTPRTREPENPENPHCRLFLRWVVLGSN